MKQKFLVSMMAFMVAFGLSALARGQEKPLTEDQVLALVRNQMADEAGAKIVQQRGIDFVPTEDFLISAKKGGASDAFLQALRAAQQPKPAGGQEKKALSQVQILALLAGDVPSSRVAMLVAQRGIDFQPSEDYLKTLEGAGAQSDLLNALRAAKPAQAALGGAASQAQQSEVQQHLTAGLEFRKRGQYPQAEQEYRAASDLDPQNPDLLVSLATVLDHEGKPDEAIATAQKALLLNPSDDHAHVALGNAYAHQADLARAITEYREAVRLNPTNYIALDNLGLALSRTGDPDGGMAEYREAMRVNPKYDHAHLNLGIALDKKGDVDGAMAEFQEAIRLNPRNDLAHMNLGVALLRKGNLRAALEQYRIGCSLNPGNQVYRRAYERLLQRVNQK
jgi:tetratricopeptide (TPR) repeat protein